jgi:hypothetical protein
MRYSSPITISATPYVADEVHASHGGGHLHARMDDPRIDRSKLNTDDQFLQKLKIVYVFTSCP